MNRIKELRKLKNLRQTDVARETCIDQKTLSNYETGKTSPDSYSTVQLAEFFGVTTDYLLGVSDFNFKNKESLISDIEQMQEKLEQIKKIIKQSN